ncbi:MAG TPA: acetolactate decarboxylase [Armatimonadota bacterium]|nr:acetolactate decarboxylase [Armatimonadota bacterium]HQK92537.1 acetolactate decarboxylase [Armatimonadota bacterium]
MRRHPLSAPLLALLLAVAFWPALGIDDVGPPPDVLFQVSTINALLDGAYTGGLSIGELRQHGDTGIGTFDCLDGELVLLEGHAYQVLATGEVRSVEDTATTPFASATTFRTDASAELDQPADLDAIKAALDGLRISDNLFYAARVDGHFAAVRTRSVPRQEKPFPPLAAVTQNQPEFETKDVDGTVVGFWCPRFVEGVNVGGWHLHFLSADRRFGGHLLALAAGRASLAVDAKAQFSLHLPATPEFLQLGIRAGKAAEIDQVEK